MEKDTVYSMRISSKVREALNRAAKKECRTVASLFNKVITDYLEKEGFFPRLPFGEERRNFPRTRISLPTTTYLEKGLKAEAFPGVALDISRGGVLVTYAKGTDIRFTSKGELPRFRVSFHLLKGNKQLCFDCIARHMRDVGREIQVGANFSHPWENDLQNLAAYLM